MTAARITCEVPGCANSSAKFAHCRGYICSRHWRTVPTALKRRRTRIAAVLVKRGELRREPDGYVSLTPYANRLMGRIWERMVVAAVEAAAGL